MASLVTKGSSEKGERELLVTRGGLKYYMNSFTIYLAVILVGVMYIFHSNNFGAYPSYPDVYIPVEFDEIFHTFCNINLKIYFDSPF